MGLKSLARAAPAALRVRMRRVGRLASGDPRDFLLSMLPPASVGAEVGVWRGDFSARVLKRVRPELLHLVDPWAYLADPSYEKALYGGPGSQADMDTVAREVAERFARARAAGRVRIHRSSSLEAAAEMGEGSLDWVYVDGDHTYEAVRADLAAWWPAVAPGGLLAGDDYDDGGWWGDSVARAVDAFAAGQPDADLVTVQHSQFVFRKT